MTAFFNEIEPYAADWLENLIAAGLIAPGSVERRSIRDLTAKDLEGFTQAHFFAGIGVWSHALRLAGWPDDVPVFTGSPPCQPWSQAGRRGGKNDERHLWPDFFRLIAECRPPVVLMEQVSSKDGLAWLDIVQDQLEGAGYAVGAFDLSCASVGAPHIRQRLYIAAVREDVMGDAGLAGTGRDAGAVPRAEGEGDCERIAAGRVDHGALAAGAVGGAPGELGDSGSARLSDAEDAGTDRGDARSSTAASERRTTGDLESERASTTRTLADDEGEQRDGRGGSRRRVAGSADDGADGGLADRDESGRREHVDALQPRREQPDAARRGSHGLVAPAPQGGRGQGNANAGGRGEGDGETERRSRSADDCSAHVVADDDDGLQARVERGAATRSTRKRRATHLLADDAGQRLGSRWPGESDGDGSEQPARRGATDRMADDDDARRGEQRSERLREDDVTPPGRDADGCGAPREPGPTNGFWADCEWVWCRDGKWRPIERVRDADEQAGEGSVEPGIIEMADEPPAWLERVRSAGPLVNWKEVPDPKPSRGGMLKAYGNAIVAELAAEFIRSVIDVLTSGSSDNES